MGDRCPFQRCRGQAPARAIRCRTQGRGSGACRVRAPSRQMSLARRTTKSVVGLDIEPSYLAAAEVSVNGQIAVQRAASVALAPGVLRDGEVTDVDALAEALRAFF